jgi:hypothetical protein
MTKHSFVLLIALVQGVLSAQPKKLVDAQVQNRAVPSGGLAKQIQSLMTTQPQPAWAAYTVPAARGRNFGCDQYWRDNEFAVAGGVVHLEPPREIMILFRFHNNQVSQIRTLAPDCDISAGGATFYWLTGVQAGESVAMLTGYAKPLPAYQNNLMESAVSAIGYHAGTAAESTLEKFLTARDQPEQVRIRAARWLASTRGKRGVEILKPVIASDQYERVRRSAVQALGSSAEPEAVEILIGAARNDRSSSIRTEALRVLARKGGPKAVAVITTAIDSDPERDVRRNAISTLKSMGDGEGIPLLIQAARSNKDPEVRKHAMSQLGQSRDPRAVAFFEEVLRSPR